MVTRPRRPGIPGGSRRGPSYNPSAVVRSQTTVEDSVMALDTFFYMYATAMLGGILAELDQIRRALVKK